MRKLVSTIDGRGQEDSDGRYFNHFHNPLKTWDQAGLSTIYPGVNGKSSVLWSLNYSENEWAWQWVRSNYYNALISTNETDRQGYFAKTFKGLGHIIHLIQDTSQPAHVRNDPHGLEALGLVEGFESWAVTNRSQVLSLMSNPTYPTVSLSTSLSGYVPITQFFDTDQYNGLSPSTSLSQGLAEYTNANFFSEDTLFDSNFSYPSRANMEYYEQNIGTWNGLTLYRKYYRKTGGGEQIEHGAYLGRFYRYLYTGNTQLFPSVAFGLDDQCYNDYASLLIPRAVGYSAGLLNYFFRGQMETSALEQTDTDGNITGLLVNVENITPGETMKDGAFVLSYRYKPSGSSEYVYGLSDTVSSGELSYNGTSTQYSFSIPQDSPIPSDATEKQYILVFKGTLGSETGAVVGKIVTVTPEQIDVTYPERFVYAIADDQSNSNFNKLRAKLRDNAPDIELTGGSVTAKAKYKLHLNHMDDLSTEPPYYAEDRSSEFYYSTSQPVSVSLDAVNYTEVEFDFSSNPIPFGVTDLSLEVTYKKNNFIAASSVKDLNEPQYISVWNSHDRFLIDVDTNSGDDVHDWRLMTEAEIMNDPAVVDMLDHDNQEPVDEPIDAMNVNFDLYFSANPLSGLPATYHAAFNNLPPGRYGRVAVITDQPYFFIKFHEKYTSSIEDTLGTGNYLGYEGDITYVILGVINQETEGIYYYSPIYGFRNIPNHFSYISNSIYPEPGTLSEKIILIKEAEWPAPADTTPYPATSINP